jgi:RES domain-containing protein
VTAQILDRVLKAFRIGDPNGQYPIFDATGSVKAPGRWNTPSCPMIYTSEHYSTAMLEKLVHGSGRLPPDQHYIEITIPNGVSYEPFNAARVPDWYSEAAASSKAFGDAWQKSKCSLILIVPSVVARVEDNILINPEHPEFPKIATSLARPVWWDGRLFAA